MATKIDVTTGVIRLFFRVKQIPRREILATRAATEMAAKMNEKMNI